MLTVMFNIKSEFSTLRILKTSEFLMSQFILVVTTVYNYTATKVPSFYEQIWQFAIKRTIMKYK